MSKINHKIRQYDIYLMLHQLAILIKSGVPIIQCFEVITSIQEKKSMQSLLFLIKKDLIAGKTLYHACKKFPLYFDELQCQLINIGEQTGKLAIQLMCLVHYQETRIKFTKKLSRALFYPGVVLSVALLVLTMMLLFIIPKFSELFAEMNTKLPFFTKCIFNVANLLRDNIFLLIFIVICSAIFLYHQQQYQRIGFFLHGCIISLPHVENFFKKIILARFTRALALTLAAGLPLTEALKLAIQTCTKTKWTALLQQLPYKISSGFTLFQSMGMMAFFPHLMLQMVKIGEESGTLEHMLDTIADFFESDINFIIESATQLLEPLIMIVLGVLIGGLIIGMYLPTFQLGNIL